MYEGSFMQVCIGIKAKTKRRDKTAQTSLYSTWLPVLLLVLCSERRDDGQVYVQKPVPFGAGT